MGFSFSCRRKHLDEGKKSQFSSVSIQSTAQFPLCKVGKTSFQQSFFSWKYVACLLNQAGDACSFLINKPDKFLYSFSFFIVGCQSWAIISRSNGTSRTIVLVTLWLMLVHTLRHHGDIIVDIIRSPTFYFSTFACWYWLHDVTPYRKVPKVTTLFTFGFRSHLLLLLLEGHNFWHLLTPVKFYRYFRIVSTFGGSLLWELYGIMKKCHV